MSKNKKRFPVSQDLAGDILGETHLIHRYLASGERLTDFAAQDPIEELNWRFAHLQAMGLYYPAPEKRGAVVWADVRIAQAEIGRIHGIVYAGQSGRNSRFTMATQPITEATPFDCRSQNHFTQIFNGKDARGLSRLDVALLAHVFQVPIPVLEAPDRRVFEDCVLELAEHRSLFRTGADFLEVVSASTPALVVVHDYEIEHYLPEKEERRERQFSIVEAPNLPSELTLGTPIVVHARLRTDLGPQIDAILLGRVGETWQLLSTPVLMGGKLSVNGDLLIPPDHVRDIDGAKLQVDAEGDFEVILISSLSSLDRFPAWIRCRRALERERTAAAIITSEDFMWLRDHVLTQGRTRTHVLRRWLNVTS